MSASQPSFEELFDRFSSQSNTEEPSYEELFDKFSQESPKEESSDEALKRNIVRTAIRRPLSTVTGAANLGDALQNLLGIEDRFREAGVSDETINQFKNLLFGPRESQILPEIEKHFSEGYLQPQNDVERTADTGLQVLLDAGALGIPGAGRLALGSALGGQAGAMIGGNDIGRPIGEIVGGLGSSIRNTRAPIDAAKAARLGLSEEVLGTLQREPNSIRKFRLSEFGRKDLERLEKVGNELANSPAKIIEGAYGNPEGIQALEASRDALFNLRDQMASKIAVDPVNARKAAQQIMSERFPSGYVGQDTAQIKKMVESIESIPEGHLVGGDLLTKTWKQMNEDFQKLSKTPERDRAMNLLKQAFQKDLETASPGLGELQRAANLSHSNLKNYEAAQETLQKIAGENGIGIDPKKWNSMIRNPDTRKQLQKIFPKQSFEDVNELAKLSATQQEISKIVNKTESMEALNKLKKYANFAGGIVSTIMGHPEGVAILGSIAGAQRVLGKILSSPQRLRLVKILSQAAKDQTPRKFALYSKMLAESLKDEIPEESFDQSF